MVRPIGKVKFVCKKCGWYKSINLISDVIYGKPDKCPKCNCTEFEIVKNQTLLNKISSVFN